MVFHQCSLLVCLFVQAVLITRVYCQCEPTETELLFSKMRDIRPEPNETDLGAECYYLLWNSSFIDACMDEGRAYFASIDPYLQQNNCRYQCFAPVMALNCVQDRACEYCSYEQAVNLLNFRMWAIQMFSNNSFCWEYRITKLANYTYPTCQDNMSRTTELTSPLATVTAPTPAERSHFGTIVIGTLTLIVIVLFGLVCVYVNKSLRKHRNQTGESNVVV